MARKIKGWWLRLCGMLAFFIVRPSFGMEQGAEPSKTYTFNCNVQTGSGEWSNITRNGMTFRYCKSKEDLYCSEALVSKSAGSSTYLACDGISVWRRTYVLKQIDCTGEYVFLEEDKTGESFLLWYDQWMDNNFWWPGGAGSMNRCCPKYHLPVDYSIQSFGGFNGSGNKRCKIVLKEAATDSKGTYVFGYQGSCYGPEF